MRNLLSVKLLRQRCNPFDQYCWRGLDAPLTVAEVQERVSTGQIYAPAITGQSYECPSREEHLQRIAYFVVHGWLDPIQVDVGIPSMGCHVNWVIVDGNHRFAAALIRGDEWIEAGCSGSMDEIEKLGQEAKCCSKGASP